jgi:sulfite reductase (NADPH) flavoprotein alpha-component
MIPEGKLNILQDLVRSSSREELIWIHGYLNGLVSSGPGNGATAVKKLSILYGTETGNSRKVALQVTAAAKKNALPAKCTAVEEYRFDDLLKEEHLLIVISTQGEGEPPVIAKKFYDQLMLAQLDLSAIKYSVLALGDSSYPQFCKIGVDVDEKLGSLGAKQIAPIQKCDVDFEEPTATWINTVLGNLRGGPAKESIAPVPSAKKHTKKNYEGRIFKNVNLNDKGSDSQTYHIEIETDEDMDYEPGDSIAIIPVNRDEVVDRIISLSGVDPSEKIITAKHEGTIRELLIGKLNICYLLTSAVKKYAQITGHTVPDMRLDLVDLLRIYPVKEPAQFIEFAKQLNPIAPRLYSIASALSSNPKEVHITVSRHLFLKEDEQHYGLCSSFLGDMPLGSITNFYIHRARQFKLPEADKDIIMVGPGTGIASFRSFLAERDNNGTSGRNWLFFGEKDFTKDFLYQTEVQQYVQTGVLHRINLAFQQNHTKTAFVEDDLISQGDEIFSWIESGAHFYLSGIKDPLTENVESAMVSIIAKHGNKTETEAKAYFDNLKKEDRYHKDVY